MMKKTWKKALAFVMTLAMTASSFSGFAAEVKAAETGEVSVVETADGITIGNGYISREFSTAGNKLSTVNITNKRTDGGDTVFTPADGSEEFIIKTVGEAASVETIDRTGWTATADSYHSSTPGASDGPPGDAIDESTTTIWHSGYNDSSTINKTGMPINLVIKLDEATEFGAWAYTGRSDVSNGRFNGYNLYVYNGNSTDFLAFDSADWGNPVLTGNFENNSNMQIANLNSKVTATQIRIEVTSSYGEGSQANMFASAADINLIEEPIVESADGRTLPASALTLAGTTYEATTAVVNGAEKSGQKITFAFEPFTFKNATWNIKEVVVMYDGDHYMRKFMEIDLSDKSLAIDYIDLESLKVANVPADAQWTIPTSAGGIVQMETFKANLGQPIYIDGMFFGAEFPATDTQIVNGTGYIRYYTGKTFEQFGDGNQLTTDGKYVTWQTVAGAARSATDIQVIQADFFEYIYSIATPSDFRIQYNSWFDNMMLISDENILESFIEMDRELNKAEVRPLDSYVVDDGWINYNHTSVVDADRAGTTLNQTGFWEFNSKFPEGLKPSSDLVHKFGSNFGVWVGPRGGYNFYGSLADIIAASGKGSKAGGSIDVADSVYHDNLTEMFVNWQEEYGVNYWKWDGFADQAQYNAFAAQDGVPGYANHHMTGGYKGMYHVTDLWEGWIDIFEAVRQSEIDHNINKLWLSLTCYTHPSPWFLQWANSVWIQCIHDQADAGSSSSKMDRQLTYRDACYYDFINNHQFQFPLANVYNHDPIYGVEGTEMTINTATDEQFQNYLYAQSARGTAFWELYFSDSIMTDGKYEVTSEFLAWAEESNRMLRNAKMFGGDPMSTVRLSSVSGSGTTDAYGFAGFDGYDGIITIRNSAQTAKDITFTFDRVLGVPEDAGTLKYHLEHTHNLTEGTPTTGTFTYGEDYTFTLQADEVRMFRVSKDGDKEIPTMVRAFSDGDKEITVKFDEKVTGKVFQVTNAKVSKVELSADDATYHITLAEAPADGAEITVTPVNVKDLAGNVAANTLSFTYNAGNVADYVSGNNGFTVAATVGAVTRGTTAPAGTLVAQSDSYELAINNEAKATFTLNGTTAVSDVTVSVGDTVVGVKENNGIQKLYVNGELSGSAYNEENRYYEVEPVELTVVNAADVVVSDIAHGYDTVADIMSETEEEVAPNVKLTGLTATASATDEGSASNLFDGDPTTFWASPAVSAVAAGNPNVVVDLGDTYTINQVDYSPRYYDGAQNYWWCTGNIKKLVVEVSTDGTTWTAVTPDGGLDISSKIVNTPDLTLFPHAVTFAPVEAKYVRISGTESYHWSGDDPGEDMKFNTVLAVGDVAVYKLAEEGGEEPVVPVATNIALNKTAIARYTANDSAAGKGGTETGSGSDRPMSMAVDGVKDNYNNYGEFGADNNRASEYMQVDLGTVCEIEGINLYRYWNDGRTYGDTVIAVAETEADFKAGNATIIYNADNANLHGLGAGTAADYAESSSGKSWTAPEGTTGRYVRVYTYGVTNGGTTNHIVELEVMGFELEEEEVTTGDLSALIARIVELNAIDKSLYTDESVAAFEAVLEPAYALAETGGDQTTIDAMVESLANAEDLLVEKEVPVVANKAALQAAIDSTADLVAEDYTADSWEALQIALSVANLVNEKADATQEMVDQAVEDLQAAIDVLVKEGEPDVPTTPVTDIFEDVSENDWFADEVQYVYDKGIMTGTSETTFEPNLGVTRATIVQTLYKLEGKPAVDDFTKYNSLNDTLDNIWWKNALAWALNTGVAKGDSNNHVFNPDNEVTREDLATFIYRYAQTKGICGEFEGNVDEILGDTFVNSWAEKAFAWAIDTGLIKGKTMNGASDLAPQVGATRAELATIMMRFYENNNL